jgi:hypothetical protein
MKVKHFFEKSHLIATVMMEFNWKTADRYMTQPTGQSPLGPTQSRVAAAISTYAMMVKMVPTDAMRASLSLSTLLRKGRMRKSPTNRQILWGRFYESVSARIFFFGDHGTSVRPSSA